MDIEDPKRNPTQNYTPVVIEQEGHVERTYDIWSRLMKDRIIMIGTPVDDYTANRVVAQLLFLQSADPQKDIHIYINSPGGSVTAGLAIYDTMQMVSCDIQTYCVGMAASMGAIFVCAGTEGKRFALPNSSIMIHQPSGGTQGTAADIRIQAKEIMRYRALLNDIIAKHTGRKLKEVEKDTNRDHYMTAQEAKEYGLVDEVLETK